MGLDTVQVCRRPQPGHLCRYRLGTIAMNPPHSQSRSVLVPSRRHFVHLYLFIGPSTIRREMLWRFVTLESGKGLSRCH